jgi:hypothetical protein
MANDPSTEDAPRFYKLRKILYGFVGPVVGLAFTYGYFYWAATPEPTIGIAIGLGVGVVTHAGALSLMIDGALERLGREQREIASLILRTKDEFVEEREADMRARMKLSRIPADSVNSELRKALDEADTVRNTFVNLSPYYLAREADTRRVLEDYSHVLFSDGPKRWVDVTTYADLLGNRYRLLEDLMQGESGSRTQKGTLKVHVCDVSCEFINFMIFERNDTPFEVYFGWIGREGNRPEVFRSTEAEIVFFFAQHFRNLERQSLESFEVGDCTSIVSRSAASRIVGTWISIPRIAENTHASEFQFYTVVSIDAVDSRWMVRADIYSQKARRMVRQVVSERVNFLGDHVDYDGYLKTFKDGSVLRTSGTYLAHPNRHDRLIGKVIGRDATTHSVSLARLSHEILNEADIDHNQAIALIDALIEDWRYED